MPELDEKREEAIVESVLFTMGKSVELRQLAAALGTDTERAEAAVRRLQSRYEAEKRGMQITQLEDSWQMATRAEYYENLIRVAATPKKQILCLRHSRSLLINSRSRSLRLKRSAGLNRITRSIN